MTAREIRALCVIAEREFRDYRDSRTARCGCRWYRTQVHAHFVTVQCSTDDGRRGCGYEIRTPICELQKNLGAEA